MTDKKIERRSLGRGLSALMSDVNLDPVQATGNPVVRPDMMVAVDRLVPNARQPRRDFEPHALEALAASLRQKGVIQPLIVRPVPGTDRFEIVAGERRWRAAQMAQLHDVPVLVRSLDDTEVLEIAIIENIQRADLNAIEEAMGFRQLMDRFGHTQEKIAEALSKSRSHVANLLRLLTLPDDVQALVREGKLSSGHARALVTSPNASALAQDIVRRQLSVRQTEAMVRAPRPEPRRPSRQEGAEKDADTRAIEADLSAALGMNVSIADAGAGGGGTLSVRYATLDDLDRLCNALSMAGRDRTV